MRLNRSILWGAVLAACALMPTVVCAQAGALPVEAGKPQLEIPETSFDFGYVPQGAKISHIYWLKNTGKDTLFIERVKPG